MFKRAAVSEGSAEDLTTRARIRDAAIVAFGEEGFGVGVRAIAAAAGVSPGLVNHHFGSKDGLRAACDDYVRDLIREAKTEYLRNPTSGTLLQSLAEIEDFAPYIAYMMRSFQAGGSLTVTLYEHLVEDVEGYLATGVEAGTLRPQKDPKATARYLALHNGGGLFFFLQLYAARHDGKLDYRQALRDYADQVMLPAVEIFTNGLLADSSALETLREKKR
ncbi:TetR/AcrR family transcriptional regulator [Nocardia pseudobrasiliensis]|uniref:TetR family transcriptional regulator n=1 Tax=Nocardia pseudobrasiliensis TaxID=45979 RepID=A0A370ID76_9NOCA|nr:TetR family transcriptional regulator [Nocardia pseudobrasiliensis]RDI68560.1 TetR family transcriptional regulator [Nocardia pseudobrasiliensis]